MGRRPGGRKKDDRSELQIKNKDAFIRMNFLYQAAALFTNPSKPAEHKLSIIYSTNIKRIGRRLVLRISPMVKRTICKFCGSLLIPALSARVRLSASHDRRMVVTCRYCTRFKRMKVKPPRPGPEEMETGTTPGAGAGVGAGAEDAEMTPAPAPAPAPASTGEGKGKGKGGAKQEQVSGGAGAAAAAVGKAG